MKRVCLIFVGALIGSPFGVLGVLVGAVAGGCLAGGPAPAPTRRALPVHRDARPACKRCGYWKGPSSAIRCTNPKSPHYRRETELDDDCVHFERHRP